MRQIALLPAGCHQCDQILVHASDDRLLFTSKLSLYVINTKTYAVEKIITWQSRAILSLSVNTYDANLVACSGVDGTVAVWNINSEEVVVKLAQACHLLEWDPHKNDQCAILCNYPKMTLHLWDTRATHNSTRRMYVHDSDTVSATVLRWNPHILGQIAIGCSNGVVYIFDCEKKNISPLKVVDRTLGVVDIQWDRLSAVYMIVAYQSFISLWDTEVGNEVHVFEKQSTGVSCLAWMDWTAGNFISSNPKTGVIKLWNASQKQPLESIRVHSAGISSMSFATGGSSRMFCTTVDGAVVLYNMKNRLVEFKTQSGHTDTIFECAYQPRSPDTLASCSYDGTVKVWSVPDLTLAQTLYGTNCIIYSCTWSPDSKKIAASTITGEVIIWDVESARLLVKYKYHDKASYSVQWSKLDPSILVSTSADSTAVVIEISLEDIEDINSQKNQRIGSRRPAKAKKQEDQYGTPRSITIYGHPAPVFGVAWAATSSSSKYFATGCQDSLVRVFVYPDDSGACLYAFSGHTARSFSVAWSPLVPGLLASGSDDQKILVWEVPLPKPAGADKKVLFLRQLVGHRSNIRALTWNYEHRQILISGSWDATIRIWNVVSSECLQVICDHVADIYTITSHPARPFTYVSCSRDSTLRVWEIEGLVLRLRMQSLLLGSLDNIVSNESQASSFMNMPMSGSLEPILHGRGSRSLSGTFSAPTSSESGPPSFSGKSANINNPVEILALAEMYRNFYLYFCGSNGSANYWDCVVAACKDRVNTTNKYLSEKYAKINTLTISGLSEAFPENAVISMAKSSARQLEQIKSTVRRGDISGKAEEQLREAAMIFAKTGDFLKYCSIMIEIGDWMSALAMAPCVSQDYWAHLMRGHSQYLKNKLSENCVPYLIGTGQDREAVDFYLQRKDALSAMIVAKMSETRTDLIPSVIAKNEEKEINTDLVAYSAWEGETENVCRERTETEEENGRKMVRQVALQLAEANMSLARPISAAAHLVSVQDFEAAVQLLSVCGELDMAYATARCFSIDTTDLLLSMAEKAEYLKDINLALTIYQQLPFAQSERESSLLIARNKTPRTSSSPFSSGNEHIVDEKEDNNTSELRSAQEAEAIGHDDEALVLYLLAGDLRRAVEIGIRRLDKFVFTPFEISPVVKKILKYLRNIRAKELESVIRTKFLCYMCWFGAYAAIQLGFWTTSWSMLKVLAEKATDDFSIPRSFLAIQEFCVRVQCKDDGALVLVDKILIELKHEKGYINKILPERVQEIIRHLNTLRTLLQDSSKEQNTELLGGRVQSMSPASLNAKSLYGVLTDPIEKEVRLLQNIIGLPILPSTLPNPPAGVHSVMTTVYGIGGAGSVHGLPTVVQGSLLPVANQGMKKSVSCVTDRKVQGTVVLLEDESSLMPLNEAIMWKKVNPFSPLFTGSFLNVY